LGDAFSGFVVLLGGLCFHLQKLGEGKAETSKKSDMEKSATREIIGEWITWAWFFHNLKRVRISYAYSALN